MINLHKCQPTKRAPDAGDSAHIPSSFLCLTIFSVGRLRRPRPSAGNANRSAFLYQINMRANSIIFLFIILASCTPSTSLRSTSTPSVSINSETSIPMLTPASCPPAYLIYNLHAPENVDELIGQYFSHPMPPDHLDDIKVRVTRSLSNSSSYVLGQAEVGGKNTLIFAKMICDGKITQTSPQTYGFYQIKSMALLPNSSEFEHLSLNCSTVDGVFDGSVAGWGYYEPTVDKNNKNKKPQYAWRVDELTESLKEIETDHIKCWYGGPG